jgi:hypothetical protein
MTKCVSSVKKKCKAKKKICNPDTGRCIDPNGRTAKKLKLNKKCPEGKVLNPATGRCVKIGGRVHRSMKRKPRGRPKKEGKSIKKLREECRRQGLVYDLKTKKCRPRKSRKPRKKPAPAARPLPDQAVFDDQLEDAVIAGDSDRIYEIFTDVLFPDGVRNDQEYGHFIDGMTSEILDGHFLPKDKRKEVIDGLERYLRNNGMEKEAEQLVRDIAAKYEEEVVPAVDVAPRSPPRKPKKPKKPPAIRRKQKKKKPKSSRKPKGLPMQRRLALEDTAEVLIPDIFNLAAIFDPPQRTERRIIKRKSSRKPRKPRKLKCTDFFSEELPTKKSCDMKKKKFRELSRKLHPDRGGSASEFARMNACKDLDPCWSRRDLLADVRRKKGLARSRRRSKLPNKPLLLTDDQQQSRRIKILRNLVYNNYTGVDACKGERYKKIYQSANRNGLGEKFKEMCEKRKKENKEMRRRSRERRKLKKIYGEHAYTLPGTVRGRGWRARMKNRGKI